jgi:hypothetical protein
VRTLSTLWTQFGLTARQVGFLVQLNYLTKCLIPKTTTIYSDYDSALMTVINGSTPEHLEMIGSEVIQRLLADKWKAYASVRISIECSWWMPTGNGLCI